MIYEANLWLWLQIPQICFSMIKASLFAFPSADRVMCVCVCNVLCNVCTFHLEKRIGNGRKQCHTTACTIRASYFVRRERRARARLKTLRREPAANPSSWWRARQCGCLRAASPRLLIVVKFNNAEKRDRCLDVTKEAAEPMAIDENALLRTFSERSILECSFFSVFLFSLSLSALLSDTVHRHNTIYGVPGTRASCFSRPGIKSATSVRFQRHWSLVLFFFFFFLLLIL